MQRLFYITISLLAVLIFFYVPVTYAQSKSDGWELHESDSRAYEVRFLKDHQIKQTELRIDDESVLFNSEIIAKLQEKSGEKTYMVKLEQTTGSKPLSRSMIAFALQSDTENYQKLAIKLNGKMMKSEEIDYNKFRGKDMFISYKKDGKDLGMRIRILFTDVSRIYLVANGPLSTAFSYRTNSFFDTIRLFDKAAVVPGKFTNDWVLKESPKKIFSIYTPPANAPYIVERPEFKSLDNTESVSTTFQDPILKYKTTYKVNAYISDKPFTPSQVRMVMIQQNVSNYVTKPDPDSIQFEDARLDDLEILTSRIHLPNTKNKPAYLNFLSLEAHYTGNILVIQELGGEQSHVLSPLGKSLFSSMQFHPKEYLSEKNRPAKAQTAKTPAPAPVKAPVPAPVPAPSTPAVPAPQPVIPAPAGQTSSTKP